MYQILPNFNKRLRGNSPLVRNVSVTTMDKYSGIAAYGKVASRNSLIFYNRFLFLNK